MNSMFATRQPARQPIAMPSPLAVSGLVVYRYTLPAPPVASTVCRAPTVTTRSAFRSSAYSPRQRGSSNPILRDVTRSMAV